MTEKLGYNATTPTQAVSTPASNWRSLAAPEIATQSAEMAATAPAQITDQDLRSRVISLESRVAQLEATARTAQREERPVQNADQTQQNMFELSQSSNKIVDIGTEASRELAADLADEAITASTKASIEPERQASDAQTALDPDADQTEVSNIVADDCERRMAAFAATV